MTKIFAIDLAATLAVVIFFSLLEDYREALGAWAFSVAMIYAVIQRLIGHKYGWNEGAKADDDLLFIQKKQ